MTTPHIAPENPAPNPAPAPAPNPAPSPAPAPAPALTGFTPVPRQKDRSNGWKPEVQRAFIEALADSGSVKAAARAVGRSPESAYALRRHPEAHEFAAAWEAALDHGVRQIEDNAIDRAINGTEETIHYHGDLVATRRRYNERLVMFILRSRLPGRFTDGRPRALNALDKQQLAKLKQEWRDEYDEELRKLNKGSMEELKTRLFTMKRNMRANMSPAQRRHEIAAAAHAKADKAAGWQPGDAYGPYAEKAAELMPQFIAEVEAEWPPLPASACEEAEKTDADDDGLASLPPPPQHQPPAAPEEEEPARPRIRTLKDDSW